MDNRDGVALVSSGDNEGVSVLSRAEKAAASSLEDENTLMYKARLRAYHNLPSLTQGKLDDLANLKGYNGGFIGMATTFWEQKIYPYFAKAFYGPAFGSNYNFITFGNTHVPGFQCVRWPITISDITFDGCVNYSIYCCNRCRNPGCCSSGPESYVVRYCCCYTKPFGRFTGTDCNGSNFRCYKYSDCFYFSANCLAYCFRLIFCRIFLL